MVENLLVLDLVFLTLGLVFVSVGVKFSTRKLLAFNLCRGI